MEEKKEEVRSQGRGRRRKKEINRRAEEEKLGAQILNKIGRGIYVFSP